MQLPEFDSLKHFIKAVLVHSGNGLKTHVVQFSLTSVEQVQNMYVNFRWALLLYIMLSIKCSMNAGKHATFLNDI